MRAVSWVLVASLLGACVGGDYAVGKNGVITGDDDDDVVDPPPGSPDFSARLSPLSAELVLGETKTFTVDLQASGGFAGTVNLTPPEVPADWQVELPATAELAADGTAQVTMTVRIPSDATAMAVMMHVTASAGTTSHATENADVLVKPELVIRIPRNALGDPDNSLGGTLSVRYVEPGTKITWVNDDDIAHRIHGDGVNGFDHEQDDLLPGASYSVTITAPGDFSYGCHLHSQMTGRLVVLDPSTN